MTQATPGWEYLSTFVGVARAGSLTGAAQVLGISQPTASRHIQALEAALDVDLFVRHARGLTLTDDGARLLESASEVAERVESIFRHVKGERDRVAGSVRVSAAEPIGGHAINPCLTRLLREFPELRVELVIDNSPADLSRREADIAARMFRPTQLDLVARRIGEVEIGLFASRSYLRRRGTPRGVGDIGHHTMIGFDRDPVWHQVVAELGLSPSVFGYRCDSVLAQIQAARDGVGIAALHVALAARHRSLVRVLPRLKIPSLEMWLVMHASLRGNAAVRTVFDHLGDALTVYVEGD